MRLAKRQSETILNIVTLLTGRAWDCIEDFTVEQLAESSAYDKGFSAIGQCLSIRDDDTTASRFRGVFRQTATACGSDSPKVSS